MQVIIDNKPAVIKAGTSFEYISENRLFTGSDSYTLSITFPLARCKENLAIFGHINRSDVAMDKAVYDCEIRSGNFIRSGTLTITELSDTELKGQFLEGRSEQNFDKSFDKVYINEIELKSNYAKTDPNAKDPAVAWDPEMNNCQCVALPWWNDSDSGLPHNFGYKKGSFQWAESTTDLTWQPYLLFIVKEICKYLKYSYDFTTWESREEYKYLLICNCLPGAWDLVGFQHALPHWTVDEFFSKLELFLGGEFEIDHRLKKISFAFTDEIVPDLPPVAIDTVIDEHTTEVTLEDNKCEYVNVKNIKYRDGSSQQENYYSCPWFIKAKQNNVITEDTLAELIDRLKGYAKNDLRGMYRNQAFTSIYYAADVDIHYILRSIDREENGRDAAGNILFLYSCILQPVNLFGPHIYDDSDDAKQKELDIVPVRIDYTERNYGKVMFLSFSGYNESSGNFGVRQPEEQSRYEDFKDTVLCEQIKNGEQSKDSEYYDRIYIAWWGDLNDFYQRTIQPHPLVENVEISDDWTSVKKYNFSLRLNDRKNKFFGSIHQIDPKLRSTFKFISNHIPDVRATFIIRGKLYLCGSITATFTENGMSQLLKGVFYPIVQD